MRGRNGLVLLSLSDMGLLLSQGKAPNLNLNTRQMRTATEKSSFTAASNYRESGFVLWLKADLNAMST